MEITIDLPMPTSTNAIWRRGRWSTYISKSYLNWMEKADAELLRQHGTPPKLQGWFAVKIIVTNKKVGKMDLDNRVKATLDWSKKAGLIEDDKFVSKLEMDWGPVPLGVRLTLTPSEQPICEVTPTPRKRSPKRVSATATPPAADL